MHDPPFPQPPSSRSFSRHLYGDLSPQHHFPLGTPGFERFNMTERPSGLNRNPTAPPVMANGHFASAEQGDTAAYEHGVQVIDENKEFKYDHIISFWALALQLPMRPAACAFAEY